MHQPQAFAQNKTEALRVLASEFPLATLIATFAGGPMINHVPMLWNDSELHGHIAKACLLYTSPSPRDLSTSRMPSSA